MKDSIRNIFKDEHAKQWICRLSLFNRILFFFSMNVVELIQRMIITVTVIRWCRNHVVQKRIQHFVHSNKLT